MTRWPMMMSLYEPWWSTEGLEACRIFGIAKPMSSSVRVSSFMKYGNWNTYTTQTL